MKNVIMTLAIIAAMLGSALFAAPAQAQATRTWVSGVGDDVNPCSRTAPCKTFAGAISKTAAGGEIDCLDPGGFGAVTITKSITIDCGTNAGGILNSGFNGVIVNGANTTDKVVLRNLVIQGTVGTTQGTNGIRFLAGQELHLDRVVIQGQSGFCVDFNKSTLGILYVKNSYFTECTNGIVVTTTSTGAVSVNNSTFAGIAGSAIALNGAGASANVTKSAFLNISGNCMVANTSGASLSAADNMLSFCSNGMNAAVSGAIINATQNSFFNNNSAFNVVAGGVFLTGGDNKVAPTASAGAG